MKRSALVTVLFSTLLLCGCDTIRFEGASHPPHDPYPNGGSHPAPAPQPGYSYPASIPAGHLPPPGRCRIWYPDREPGHQPPPGDCHQLSHNVPPGAWLVSRAQGNDKQAFVTFYHHSRPGVVLGSAWYDARTGSFISSK